MLKQTSTFFYQNIFSQTHQLKHFKYYFKISPTTKWETYTSYFIITIQLGRVWMPGKSEVDSKWIWSWKSNFFRFWLQCLNVNVSALSLSYKNSQRIFKRSHWTKTQNMNHMRQKMFTVHTDLENPYSSEMKSPKTLVSADSNSSSIAN